MPDDLEQVAEPEVTETAEPEDVLKNESDAFEVDDDAAAKEPTQDEQDKEPEKEDADADESAEDEEKADETEDESDEDLKRGKEILDAKKAEEEQRAQSDTEEKQPDEPEDLRKESFTADTVTKIAEYVPKNLLPESVKLPDGTELDFKTVMADYPEIPHIVAAYANNIIRQMVNNGFLVSGNRLQDFDKTIDRRSFIRTVTHPQYGVPQADKIVKSDEYKAWVEKQPPEIQVLRESGNPFDMIRVLKRFQGQGILGDAKADAEKADKQRQEKKAAFDSAHKTTKKNKGTPSKPKTEAVDSKAEEMEAFLSDDDE